MKATEISKTHATLTWQPPEFDGGSPIKGYYVERKSGTRWIKVNKKPIKDLELKIDDLIEKDTYEFRVCAENEAGVGKPCQSIEFVAKDPFDVPGQPGRPVVEEMTADSAALSWKAPESDGGSPITNYVVEYRRVGDTR